MDLKVADQAWIATALLHREEPARDDFRLEEILGRAAREFGFPKHERTGVWQHIVGHAVASNPPSPARHRMLTKTQRGRRRLFRTGDPVAPGRDGKVMPLRDDIPAKYHALLDWYESEYNRGASGRRAGIASAPSAFLAFVGLIPAYDLHRMEAAIEQDSERIEDDPARSEGQDVA